jgi:hypothetical protein
MKTSPGLRKVRPTIKVVIPFLSIFTLKHKKACVFLNILAFSDILSKARQDEASQSYILLLVKF